MSAFICNPTHIKTLAIFAAQRASCGRNVRPEYLKAIAEKQGIELNTAAMQSGRETELASLYANILYQENIRSVQTRYGSTDLENLPGLIGKPATLVVTPRELMQAPMDPVKILKACDCLDYQSCETEDYNETLAAHLIFAIRKAAIHNLPGYQNAPWEIELAERDIPDEAVA